MKLISPLEASQLISQGALLVDIRTPDEVAREHIHGALNMPLATASADALPKNIGSCVIFHCRSGMRTLSNASTLESVSQDCDAYVMEGGLDAWKRAGLPTKINAKAPLELNRQVQIGAGSLILLSFILGHTVSPAFFWLSAVIGAGLVFAGVSGVCGLARALVHMPWNRALK